MRLFYILLTAVIAFSPIHAEKKSKIKLKKDSYHQICLDLQDKVLKPGKSLNRSESKAIEGYLKAKKVNRLKKRNLKHFESAIKKHRYVGFTKLSKKKGNNLKKWPKKTDVGNWYEIKGSKKSSGGDKTNSSSGNEDTTNELIDQNHEQTN